MEPVKLGPEERAGKTVDDDGLYERIEQLVSEEHGLWQREAEGATTTEERRRLESLNVSLDQYWDLLRQRRALREAAEVARVRDPEVVEGYER
ncbi:MAG TPA: DUF2630 family protein [Gaiellaceae bacterium]|nr:DUF2630 family protein [Gaiellaceae bacterium]